MESTYLTYQQARISFWNRIWDKRQNRKGWGGYYHNRLIKIYKFIIPTNSTILEVGCGNGKLIGKLSGSYKLGIDFSENAIELAQIQFPDCQFICTDLADFETDKTFDYIIISDLVGDLWDIELALNKVSNYCHDETRIVFNFYSKLWELPLRLGEKLGLKKPNLQQNWVTKEDLTNLLYLTDYEIIKQWQEVLFPFKIPLFSWLCNRILVKLPLFNLFALSNFIVSRPIIKKAKDDALPSVSVIVAARNEAGHIQELIERVPKMGSFTELIFVEGGSDDNTYETIESEIQKRSREKISLYKQSGKGKGNAVRKGFEEANGDVLMILDADITVPPEKLVQFYNSIINGKGEFINGVRLVYPMEKKAMRFFNLVGNKFFSLSFSWVLGQTIKDTLCGTKVLRKRDYVKIINNRNYFGDFDPFGDFDLIFGAAKLNLKILDLPIRYQERKYGETNIQRWRHGWLLLRMLIFSLTKIKFI